MRHFDMPVASCPVCDAKLDAATSVGDGECAPDPTDSLTVCAYCASFLQLTNDYDLRLLTLEQIGELPDVTRIELQRIRRAILNQ